MKYLILPVLLIFLLIFIALSINFIPDSGKIEKNLKISSRVFNSYNNKLLLVFFGYVGCNNICTPRMTETANIYQQLKQNKQLDIGVVFINLTKLANTELPDLYAKNYNMDFHGEYLETAALNDLLSEFGVYSSPSLLSENTYNHTGSLFLLKKELEGYNLKRIYISSPFDQSLIITDINNNFL